MYAYKASGSVAAKRARSVTDDESERYSPARPGTKDCPVVIDSGDDMAGPAKAGTLPISDQPTKWGDSAMEVVGPEAPEQAQAAQRPKDPIDPYQGINEIINETVPPKERLDLYLAFEVRLKAHRDAWVASGSPLCTQCEGRHHEPCLTIETRKHLAAIRKAGQKLNKEARKEAKKNEPEPAPPKAKAERKAKGAEAPKSKARFCTTCAKQHPGGKEECTAPLCMRGCRLNHFLGEPCARAIDRFKRHKLYQGEERGEEESPVLSKAMAEQHVLEDETVAKMSTIFDSLPNDPDALRVFGQLLSHEVAKAKRKAAEPLPKEGGFKKPKTEQASTSEPQGSARKPEDT